MNIGSKLRFLGTSKLFQSYKKINTSKIILGREIVYLTLILIHDKISQLVLDSEKTCKHTYSIVKRRAVCLLDHQNIDYRLQSV